MESFFARLTLIPRTENEKKVLELFVNKCGNKLEQKSKLALNFMADGKDFGRSLADSLEKK